MELKNWYLRKIGENVVAIGNVYNNSRFPDGMNITTSRIMSLNVNLQDKCLEIVTYSGSRYKAAFAEISYESENIKITRASLRLLKTSSDFIGEAVFLAKKKEQEFVKILDKELLNGDFYIELSATAVCKAYFKYDDDLYKVPIQCHVGIFVDSYLYRIMGVACLNFWYMKDGSVVLKARISVKYPSIMELIDENYLIKEDIKFKFILFVDVDEYMQSTEDLQYTWFGAYFYRDCIELYDKDS